MLGLRVSSRVSVPRARVRVASARAAWHFPTPRAPSSSPPRAWIAIDDLDLVADSGVERVTAERFVHTDDRDGLTGLKAEEAVAKLLALSYGTLMVAKFLPNLLALMK